MSQYEDPADAVRAALQVQLRLRDHNKTSAAGEQIHVRIGLNTGMGIVEEKDVFGDVVNVAARVESLADGDEIFVTEDTYREVKNNDEFIFRFADAAKVRGKKEALKAYRLVWHEEELHLGQTRKGPAAHQRQEGVYVVEASVSGKNLKISAYGRKGGEERAVKSYKEIPYHEDKVREITKSIIDVLNRANRRGKIGNDLLVKLKELGGLLFDLLVPLEVKESLKKITDSNLMLAIDDRLVHIPWELLFDGKDFLCQRFSIGRSVSTKQAVSVNVRALQRPLKMQVLADPRGDLPDAYEEGVAIKNELVSFEDWLDVSLKTTDIATDYAKSKIRNFDIVHYAGHAEHNTERPEDSAWLLKDGSLRASEVVAMAGSRPMPALVFSNACQTGQTEAWKLDEDYGSRIFGMANAFLLSGVQHYIGTFWEIPDEAGSYFAKSFYRSLAGGVTIGEALRSARSELIQKYGEDTIVWASYMLYGDPTTRYVVAEQEEHREEQEVKAASHQPLVADSLRGPVQVTVPPANGKKNLLLVAGIAGLVAAVIVGILVFGKERSSQSSSQPSAAVKMDRADDAASQKRISELAAELAAQYRSGKVAAPTQSSDEWSSRPVTLVFMDLKTEGGIGEKQVSALTARVAQALAADGRVQMVERELLQKVLEELQLSSSNLTDPATALKIGKLLSARILASGSLMQEKKGMTVILRFIDTETTAVRKVLTLDSPSTDVTGETAQSVAKGINEWVTADFPLHGRVQTLAGDVCVVNLGQAHGLKKGDRLEIVKEAKKGTGLFAVTGELEVTEPSKERSQARIVSKTETVREGSAIRLKL